MPLNGAGLASKPSGTTAVANTTILSAAFNSVIDDIYSIFNTARPVAYGGTGGTSVITGWDGLAAQGTDIASAGTINLTTATGPLIDITGTTAISTVTLAQGSVRIARATGAFRLTASSSLVVNGSTSVSYTTTAQDLLLFEGYGSSVVRVWVISTPLYGLTSYPPGTLYGLTLSNNAGTPASKLDIAVGSCRDSSDAANIDLLSALTAKDLATAWAVGSSAGMLATGVAVANGTYHIFLIKRPDTGVVDVAADTSVTGANIAANTNAAYTLKRRIGSIVRSAGSILAFKQYGDLFLWDVQILDINATNPGTSAVTRTLTLPTGVVVWARVIALIYTGNATTRNLLLTPLAISDSSAAAVYSAHAESTGNTNGQNAVVVPTNTSAQVRSRIDTSDVNAIEIIQTVGWIDGRDRT